MIEAISEIPTIALLVLLIAGFVVAFKLLEMVFETITVSVLSGLFYFGLVYFFDYPLNVDRVLLFSFLGSSLYMIYSLMASAYSIFSKVIGIPYNILNALFRYAISATGKKRQETKLKQKMKGYAEKAELFADKVEAKAERSKNQKKKQERDVKEVVLDKVKEDNRPDDETKEG